MTDKKAERPKQNSVVEVNSVTIKSLNLTYEPEVKGSVEGIRNMRPSAPLPKPQPMENAFLDNEIHLNTIG